MIWEVKPEIRKETNGVAHIYQIKDKSGEWTHMLVVKNRGAGERVVTLYSNDKYQGGRGVLPSLESNLPALHNKSVSNTVTSHPDSSREENDTTPKSPVNDLNQEFNENLEGADDLSPNPANEKTNIPDDPDRFADTGYIAGSRNTKKP